LRDLRIRADGFFTRYPQLADLDLLSLGGKLVVLGPTLDAVQRPFFQYSRVLRIAFGSKLDHLRLAINSPLVKWLTNHKSRNAKRGSETRSVVSNLAAPSTKRPKEAVHCGTVRKEPSRSE